MNEKFERVHFDGDEGIKPKLYKRTYIAAGKNSEPILFTDWQSVRRKVAAGKDFERAIQKVYDLDKEEPRRSRFR